MTTTPFWCLGIDPGRKGAIAALRSDIAELLILRMPMLGNEVDVREIRTFVDAVRAKGDIRHAVIEKAQVMPAQGAVSGFTYGVGYGMLKAVLTLMDIPFEESPPSRWKMAVLGAAAKSPHQGTAAARAARKRQIKEVAVLAASRLFPATPFMKTEDGPAEAALMAEASRRTVLTGSMSRGAIEASAESPAAPAASKAARKRQVKEVAGHAGSPLTPASLHLKVEDGSAEAALIAQASPRTASTDATSPSRFAA